MKRSLQKIFNLLRQAAYKTVEHNGPEQAGNLAFLLLLSIFPFLFFFTAFAGYFANLVDESSYKITRKLASLFVENVPENIIDGIMPYIEEILQGPTQSLLTFAILGAVWTASSVIGGIKSVMNNSYGFSSGSDIYSYLLDRFISILEFLAISVSLFLFLVTPRIITTIKSHDPFLLDLHLPDLVWHFLPTIFLFSFVSMLYMFLPKKKQKFKSVALGSFVVVFLWATTSRVFSFYIKFFAQVSLIYGSIAGIIIVLLFFYITNLCFIYGSEINACISNFKSQSCAKK